jgi:hypothetical protein
MTAAGVAITLRRRIIAGLLHDSGADPSPKANGLEAAAQVSFGKRTGRSPKEPGSLGPARLLTSF